MMATEVIGYLQGDERLHNMQVCMWESAIAFLIASFNVCFLGNEATGPLGGTVCQMRNGVICLALM